MACGAFAPPIAPSRGKTARARSRPASRSTCWSPTGEQGAEIYSAATTRDQARIVFDEAKRMVGSSPALKRRVQVLINNLNVEASASRFMPLSSDASSMDGLNVHGAIIDELHAHKTRHVVDVLETATGARRQPLLFEITTAGYDRHSICFEHHDYAIKLLERTLSGR
jgi:phage terminase large subunit-like protein